MFLFRVNYFFIFLLLMGRTIAQNDRQTDSLLNVISVEKSDTAKISHFCKLAQHYQFLTENEKALDIFSKVITLAEKYNNYKRIIESKNQSALIYINMDNYERAIALLNDSYVSSEKNNYTKGKGNSLRFRALVYLYQGDYEKATDYYLKAQKIWEELADDNLIAIGYSDLAVNFYYRSNFKKAIEYWEKALEGDLKANNINNVVSDYSNLATANIELKNYDIAAGYLDRSIDINIKNNNKSGIASGYNNLAQLYDAKGDISEAISFMLKSTTVREQLAEKSKLAGAYLNLCELYRKNKDNNKAIEYGIKGLALVESTGNAQELQHAYLNMATIYSGMKNYEKAYIYQSKFFSLKDSLLDEKNSKQINELEKKYESDKKEKENQLLNQKLQLQDSQAKQQRLISLIAVVGVIALLGIAFILFRQNKQKQKANILLEEKNKIIKDQKHVVEEKNKEIVDSINYAQKIQSAILPATGDFEESIGNCFVFLKPKDIVSGDFYWISEKDDYIFYATADCTGHGVPGGFMSMLGSSLLNEVVNEKKIYEPADILDLLRVKIILALKQKGQSGENKDGMDMVVCRINKTKTELTYAAANNPLWIVRNGECLEYRCDKQPVGISGGELVQFNQHTLALQKDDCIYTFTDGYADQFGGPKGKKFKYRQLKELLKKNQGLPVVKQKTILEDTLMAWKGNLEQVDDILIIGIKVA